jgi:hypothetical protein
MIRQSGLSSGNHIAEHTSSGMRMSRSNARVGSGEKLAEIIAPD